jgi:2-polyprenyl-3-methyl-5-hydroxy-6-metoxy-1,4-benzoquinol methylase
MWKKFKDRFYYLKEWYLKFTTYPKHTLNLDDHFDYDEYWKKKRGQVRSRMLGKWQKRRADLVVHYLKDTGSCTIGDIGSGGGEVLEYIKEHSHVTHAYAYDSSDYALENSKEIGAEPVKIDIVNESDLAKIRPSDYMLLFEILEHVPAPEKLLARAYSQAQKGVFFSFPNTGFFIFRYRLMFMGKFPMQWLNHPSEHLRFWTKKDLHWWLHALGYKKYTVNYYVGVPLLRTIWPALFAAGFFVKLDKEF